MTIYSTFKESRERQFIEGRIPTSLDFIGKIETEGTWFTIYFDGNDGSQQTEPDAIYLPQDSYFAVDVRTLFMNDDGSLNNLITGSLDAENDGGTVSLGVIASTTVTDGNGTGFQITTTNTNGVTLQVKAGSGQGSLWFNTEFDIKGYVTNNFDARFFYFNRGT